MKINLLKNISKKCLRTLSLDWVLPNRLSRSAQNWAIPRGAWVPRYSFRQRNLWIRSSNWRDAGCPQRPCSARTHCMQFKHELRGCCSSKKFRRRGCCSSRSRFWSACCFFKGWYCLGRTGLLLAWTNVSLSICHQSLLLFNEGSCLWQLLERSSAVCKDCPNLPYPTSSKG